MGELEAFGLYYKGNLIGRGFYKKEAYAKAFITELVGRYKSPWRREDFEIVKMVPVKEWEQLRKDHILLQKLREYGLADWEGYEAIRQEGGLEYGI